MKESQGAICVDPAPLAVTQGRSIVRSFADTSRETGHSLLLLQLRTELEGKWRPDKFGILRKWMGASPKHWFCQKEDAYDYAVRPGLLIRNVTKRNVPRRVRTKKVGVLPKSKTALMERLAQQVAPSLENEKFVDCRGDSEIPLEKKNRRSRRFKLEEEVMVLQKQLQKEVDLHLILEKAINVASGARPQHLKDIPTNARELLEDIAALETVVAALEDKSIALQGSIGAERREREFLETSGAHFRERSDSNASKGSQVLQRSRQAQTSCRTRTPPKVQQPAESDASSKPVFLYNRFRITSVICDAASEFQLSSATGDVELSTLSSSSKPRHRSGIPRKVSLSWKSTESNSISSEDSLSSTFSSDSISKHEFLSVLDSLRNGNFSAALQAEAAAMPSPARVSFCEAPASDQSGSLGPCSGREKDFGASSPLVSEPFFLLPTSPSTPEHRLRPSSPAQALMRQFSCDGGALPSQDIPLTKQALGMGESPDVTCSLSRRTKNSSFANDEFFTPRTSISGFGDSSGDSHSASMEKVRNKVRVKLNLQADEKPKNAEEASPEKKTYDAEYVNHRNLWNELSPGVHQNIFPPGGRSAANDYRGRDYSKTPNLLSEEMMKCMIGIYWHLADPAVVLRNQSFYDSPISHLGNTGLSSSVSSFSEYSLMSFVRSPLVDLRSKDDILGCESSPDPYRTRGRIPWADIGLYGKVLEVPWMSVKTDQLGYGTQALNKFRFLVEQLSEVDPLPMSHSQKLAFWLNLYNSLMMHAFLTYGIPRNDLKYFALLQKAAFNVGGHCFNAATIEHSLLRGKTPYRPQLGLLLALHRIKWTLTEEQSKFAIDYPEPQMIFSLCCGARSSPAVRVYTAAKVHKEMNNALRDYARATVGLNGKGKLLVPKLLYFYAHDFVDDARILDWVCQYLPPSQAALVRECWQHRQKRLLGKKSFAILPLELNFRYLFAPIFDPSGDLH